MINNKKNVAIIGIFFLMGIFFVWNSSPQKNTSGVDFSEYKVTVYKSITCMCCPSYIDYLKNQGFQVEIINTEDMSSIKRKYQIPPNMGSCHTALMGDYFVEGHVPMEAVKKLLEEKPAIDGISLPGMPLGSPGMPGTKRGAFKIYALSKGVSSEFMTL